jgi:hypothetical protein
MSVLTHHTYRVRATDLETEMRRAKKSNPCALDYIVLLSRRTTAQLRTETLHTFVYATAVERESLRNLRRGKVDWVDRAIDVLHTGVGVQKQPACRDEMLAGGEKNLARWPNPVRN